MSRLCINNSPVLTDTKGQKVILIHHIHTYRCPYATLLPDNNFACMKEVFSGYSNKEHPQPRHTTIHKVSLRYIASWMMLNLISKRSQYGESASQCVYMTVYLLVWIVVRVWGGGAARGVRAGGTSQRSHAFFVSNDIVIHGLCRAKAKANSSYDIRYNLD